MKVERAPDAVVEDLMSHSVNRMQKIFEDITGLLDHPSDKAAIGMAMVAGVIGYTAGCYATAAKLAGQPKLPEREWVDRKSIV